MTDTDEMEETAAKLDSALDSAADESDDADDLAAPAALIERAESDVESLSRVLSGEERFVDAKDDIEDLIAVIEATDELLETVDVAELPEAIDVSELPAVIDAEEVPAAIANADPERAVELEQLASLVEFSELWDAVEVREFMDSKNDLEDAVGDLSDDDTADSSLVESLGSFDADEGSGSFIEQDEAMQAAIQSTLEDAVEEFRESVLDAHDQLDAARQQAQQTVEEKTGGRGQPTSRNPTAFSTLTAGWTSGGWSSAALSTVPQSVRHSNAPSHPRVYGRRFDNGGETNE